MRLLFEQRALTALPGFQNEGKAVGWISQEQLIVKIYGVCFLCQALL